MSLQNAASNRPPSHLGRIVLIIVAILAPANLAASEDTRPPNLSGTWNLDPHLSDDPLEKLEESRLRGQSSGASGGWISTGADGEGAAMMPIGGTRPQKQNAAKEDNSPRSRQIRLAELTAGIEALTIVHNGDSMSIRRADGRIDEYELDGKKMVVVRGFNEVDVKAKWEGRRLIVTTKSKRDKVMEIYGLVGDNDEILRILVRIDEGRGAPLELKRYYRLQVTQSAD